MHGLMMDDQLIITRMIEYAARYHGSTEIVSRTVEGPMHRYTYADAYTRIQKLGNALNTLGVELGDRVATFAWNGYRHLELYFAISAVGAVCHAINPRLFPDQLDYIINHAEDRFIFLDITFVPLLEAIKDKLPKVEGYIVMTDREHMPETSLPNVMCYEDLLDAEPDTIEWPEFDERTASSMCYTSGTTGNPKGALYSHRSTVLHTMFIVSADVFSLSCKSVIMPATPMFHVYAWGTPYAAAMVGCKFVLPGPAYDGASIYELLETEKATMAVGVPTVWMMLLDYVKKEGKSFPHLEATGIGGSAVPRSMIDTFEDDYDVRVFHAWGMTEMSPVGTTAQFNARTGTLPKEERRQYQAKQGRTVCGVEMKIIDDDGNELPRDGTAFGEVAVRGPWVISAYYKDEEATRSQFTDDGWFLTGDVATLDAEGYMQIVDRSKDVIKSGGEWISSIDLENAAVGHPDVMEAAVIGMPHPKWDERPLLVIVKGEGAQVSKDDMIGYLEDKVAKWWLPDDVAFVDELPHTATGKIAKRILRDQFRDYTLPTV
ncbi:MAG: 3-(methylthio)propionyl-CoA ligase [Hyphomicrobiales bacterium]